MSSKSIQISPSSSALPTTTPHLMPFHIDHSGPAPLSTYFIVKAVPPPSEPVDSNLARRVKTRFLSAFRGRTMQGLMVDLPEGFSGVVLNSDDIGKGKAPARERPTAKKGKGLKKGGRSTRNSIRGEKNEVDHDDDTTMEDQESSEDSAPTKTLRPSAKFSSFTLWNADVDVDEGRDEYLRSLFEYQRLSSEVHRIG